MTKQTILEKTIYGHPWNRDKENNIIWLEYENGRHMPRVYYDWRIRKHDEHLVAFDAEIYVDLKAVSFVHNFLGSTEEEARQAGEEMLLVGLIFLGVEKAYEQKTDLNQTMTITC